MGRKARRNVKRTTLQDGRVPTSSGGQERSPAVAVAADRLSSLPDEVLLFIVSHLPVREVVRMSALSRRWRHFPSLLPVLDLLHLSSWRRERQEEKKEAEFDWVAYWGLIRRCVFSSRNRKENRQQASDQWAEAIAAKGIREIEVFLDDEQFDAYPILHHCKSLIKLKLICCSLFGDIAKGPRCTELRELDLEHVDIRNGLFQDLISSCCTRLETLRIWDCLELGRLRIGAAPCLQRLEFGYQEPHPDWDDVECDGVIVDAPSLERLHICVLPRWCEVFTVRVPKLTSLRVHLIEEKEDMEGPLREESEEDDSDEVGSLQEESEEDEWDEVGSLQEESEEEESEEEGSLEEESGVERSLQEESDEEGSLEEESGEEVSVQEESEAVGSLQEESGEEVSLQEESEEKGSLQEESESDESLKEVLGKKGPLQPWRVVAEGLRRLLDNATKFLSLELTGATIQCLSPVVAAKRFRPSFVSLTRLCVELSLRDKQQASCLAKLLRYCHCLQVLKLYVSRWMTKSHYFHNKVPFYPVLVFWEHQKTLEEMGCLNHHLQEVAMYGLVGEIYEMKLACFFLMEARALKKLSLKFRTDHREARDIIANHLPNLRKGSSEAKVELSVTEYMLY